MHSGPTAQPCTHPVASLLSTLCMGANLQSHWTQPWTQDYAMSSVPLWIEKIKENLGGSVAKESEQEEKRQRKEHHQPEEITEFRPGDLVMLRKSGQQHDEIVFS